MPFCSRCGKEVPPNLTFCMHCGSPLATPMPGSPPSRPVKVSHLKRNLVVIGIIILVLAVLGVGTSLGPSGTTSSSKVQEGGTVAIGQAITVKLGENEVPVRFIFNSASLNTTFGYVHHQADIGYQFLIVKVTLKNVGNSEVGTYDYKSEIARWEVTVDKGYVYKEVSFGDVQTPQFTLRPEEEKVGYIVFEILKDTTPLEVRYYTPSSNSPSITLNLRGYVFETLAASALFSPGSIEVNTINQITAHLQKTRLGNMAEPLNMVDIKVTQFVTLLFQRMRQ